MTDLEIIDAVEKVRQKNNLNWMNILRIGFKHAPEETRAEIKKIHEADSEIGKLFEQLAKNG